MQPVFILAVLAFMVASEIAASGPVDDCLTRVLLVVGGCTSVVLFAVVGTSRVRRASRQERWRSRTISRLRDFHFLIWFVVSGGILFGLEWTRVVRFNWRLEHMILLDELIILAPAIGSLFFSWAVFYRIDGAAFEGEPSPRWADLRQRLKYVLSLARHHLGLVLLPVLFVVSLHDIGDVVCPEFLNGRYCGVGYIVGLVAFLVGLPFLLTKVLPTERLADGPIRQKLEQVAVGTKFAYRELLLWKSDGRITNAAVVGLAGRLRFVLLSDGLLNHLTDDEVESVFVHEVAHICRHHHWFRLLVILQPINVYLVGHSLLSVSQPDAANWLHNVAANTMVQVFVMLPVLAVYGVVVFGHLSRRMEVDADLWAVELQGPQYLAALERLAIHSGTERQRKTWLHPSLDDRIELLQQVAAHPELAWRVRGRLTLIHRALVMATLLAAMMLLI